ncbi:MAG: metallophosphoesterase [Candidatus Hydrogenedentes bacterium]|nr:metallophosphoesterase [Candidatus Hydrogenedentota bacterium]
MNRCAILCGSFLYACCAVAFAREADGALGLIHAPHNGAPAISEPGGSFEAVLEHEAGLALVGDTGPLPLEVIWSDLPGGWKRAFCAVPESAAAGTYALEARTPDGTDRHARAVFLYAHFPDYYVIAHLTDAHVGSTRHARAAEVIFADLLRVVNDSDATLAVITGDLTDSGSPEQFRAFLRVLDTCRLPTFVQPGNHDREGTHYETFFGPLTYMFRFGYDGFLAFDTKDYVMADELGRQDADLQVFRRALKPCRWTVGLTHRYEQMMGLRSQLILFVDEPLDALAFGHFHRENTQEEAVAPWGKTQLIMTPAAVDGWLRFIDMTISGVLARAPEQRVPID